MKEGQLGRKLRTYCNCRPQLESSLYRRAKRCTSFTLLTLAVLCVFLMGGLALLTLTLALALPSFTNKRAAPWLFSFFFWTWTYFYLSAPHLDWLCRNLWSSIKHSPFIHTYQLTHTLCLSVCSVEQLLKAVGSQLLTSHLIIPPDNHEILSFPVFASPLLPL